MLVHLRIPGADRFPDLVVDACLRDLNHDRQCDVDRTGYTMEVVDASEAADLVRPAAIAALETVKDKYDRCHVEAIVHAFAVRGSAEARAALRAHFERSCESRQFAAGHSLIELEGREGLLHLARRVGGDLPDAKLWRTTSWLTTRDEAAGAGAGERELTDASSDPRIAAFLEALRRAQVKEAERERRVPRPALSYRALKEELRAGSLRFPDIAAGRCGHAATPGEVSEAVADLGSSDDPVLLRALTRFFARARRRSFDPSPVLGRARDPDPAISNACLWALDTVSDLRVRRLAVELLERGPLRAEALRLLEHNRAPQDALLVWRAVEARPPTDDRLDQAVHRVVSLFAKDPAPEAMDLLEWAYEDALCTLAREDAFRALVRRRCLPPDIAEEACDDANPDIRSLAPNGGTTP